MNQCSRFKAEPVYLECCEHYSQLAVFQMTLNQVFYEVDLCPEMLDPSTDDNVMKDWKQFVHRPLIATANVRLHQLKQQIDNPLSVQFIMQCTHRQQMKLSETAPFTSALWRFQQNCSHGYAQRQTIAEITTNIYLFTMLMLNSESQLFVNILYWSTTLQSTTINLLYQWCSIFTCFRFSIVSAKYWTWPSQWQ